MPWNVAYRVTRWLCRLCKTKDARNASERRANETADKASG
jgi:hypothetical protein